MLISKKISNHLKDLFTYEKRIFKKPYMEEPYPLDVPPWVTCLKNSKFIDNICYISDSFNSAVDNFRSSLSKNEKIINDWAIYSKDFQIVIIYPFLSHNCFFVEKTGTKVFVAAFSGFSNKTNTYTGSICCFDLISGNFETSVKWERFLNVKNTHKLNISSVYSYIIPILIFLDYAEIEERIVKAKTKNKGIKKKSESTNLSDFDIKRLDSMYFTRIYREGGFSVNGHFRLQPCGEGLRDRKLIYINPFTKNGYTRRAGIEINPR